MKTAIELATELRDLVDLHTHAYDVCERSAAMLLQQADQIEALTKQVFALTGEVANKADYAKSMYLMHQEAQAQCEALKADAERLDWLSEMAHKRHGVTLDYGKYVEDGLVLERGYRVTYYHKQGDRQPTLRAAIDAMKGKS